MTYPKALQMVFTNREQRIFYRTILGVGAMIMQQLTGINLITYAPFPSHHKSILTSKNGITHQTSSLNLPTCPKASQLSCMSGLPSLFYHLSTPNPHLPNRQSRSTPFAFHGSSKHGYRHVRPRRHNIRNDLRTRCNSHRSPILVQLLVRRWLDSRVVARR